MDSDEEKEPEVLTISRSDFARAYDAWRDALMEADFRGWPFAPWDNGASLLEVFTRTATPDNKYE